MTLLLLEGFEVSQGTTQLSRKWAIYNGTVGLIPGRQTVGSAITTASMNLQSVDLGTVNRMVVGCGVRLVQTGTVRALRFLDVTATIQCTVSFTSVDTHFLIELRRGDETGTVVATLGRIAANKWHFLEFDVTVHNTTGAIEFKVDGTSVHTSSGLNTANTGTPGVRRLHWFIVGGTIQLDDIYVDDDTFRGPVTISGIHPSANGAELDYIPSSGTNHAALLDDAPGVPDDATFVTTNDVGQRELVEMDNLPSYIASNAPVVAVSYELTAQMAAAGNRDLNPRYRTSGGSLANSAVVINFSLTSLTTKQAIVPTNPVTVAAWTITEINDGQFGLETAT